VDSESASNKMMVNNMKSKEEL